MYFYAFVHPIDGAGGIVSGLSIHWCVRRPTHACVCNGVTARAEVYSATDLPSNSRVAR